MRLLLRHHAHTLHIVLPMVGPVLPRHQQRPLVRTADAVPPFGVEYALLHRPRTGPDSERGGHEQRSRSVGWLRHRVAQERPREEGVASPMRRRQHQAVKENTIRDVVFDYDGGIETFQLRVSIPFLKTNRNESFFFFFVFFMMCPFGRIFRSSV